MTQDISEGSSDSKMVGPIIRGVDGEFIDALIEAIDIDNPDSEVVVDDQAGYVRIGMQRYCRVTRATLEEILGRSFALPELEPSLGAFAGRMKMADDEIVWYLDRED